MIACRRAKSYPRGGWKNSPRRVNPSRPTYRSRITEDEFNAMAGHLIATLKGYKVTPAEIDELVGIVAGTAKDIIEVKK